MQYILSRDEFQPCPGKIAEWSTWSNCDRSCDNGIRIRTRGCFDKNGNQLGFGSEDLHSEGTIVPSDHESDFAPWFSTPLKILDGVSKMNAKFKCAIWEDVMMKYGLKMDQDGPGISGQPGPIGITAMMIIWELELDYAISRLEIAAELILLVAHQGLFFKKELKSDKLPRDLYLNILKWFRIRI